MTITAERPAPPATAPARGSVREPEPVRLAVDSPITEGLDEPTREWLGSVHPDVLICNRYGHAWPQPQMTPTKVDPITGRWLRAEEEIVCGRAGCKLRRTEEFVNVAGRLVREGNLRYKKDKANRRPAAEEPGTRRERIDAQTSRTVLIERLYPGVQC